MERIVVGVDGSEAAEAALAFAVEEGRVRGAKVEAVMSWHEPYVAPTMVTIEPNAEVFADAAKATLDKAVDALGDTSGVEIERRVLRGNAAGVLLEAAEGAAMLVVGSRGRGGFTGLLLGSVSQQVVQHARCPVVVVPHAAAD